MSQRTIWLSVGAYNTRLYNTVWTPAGAVSDIPLRISGKRRIVGLLVGVLVAIILALDTFTSTV